MSEVLFQYQRVYPTTWVYLSSLLMIGLFFKFNRFWSMRNLDLILLILLAPGLLLAYFGNEMQQSVATQSAVEGKDSALAKPPSLDDEASSSGGPAAQTNEHDRLTEPVTEDSEEDATRNLSPTDEETGSSQPANDGPEDGGTEGAVSEPGEEDTDSGEQASNDEADDPTVHGQKLELLGYIWLMLACGVWLIRLLMDSTMVRRPLLEPNLSAGGLAFIGFALFMFLMGNVAKAEPAESDLEGLQQLQAEAAEGEEDSQDDLRKHGPGYSLLFLIPSLTTQTLYSADADLPHEQQVAAEEVMAAKVMAVLAQLAIVVGMVLIGYRHFNNVRMGLGAAMIYLMLPYTALMTGHNDHSLPAALLVWAVFAYRRPLISGLLLGLGAGVVYYPLFLLPLWLSFYWKRGLGRVVVGVALALGAMVLSLLLNPRPDLTFWDTLRQMFGVWTPVLEDLQGIWNHEAGGFDPHYRLPVLAAFWVLSFSMALWPAQKNLGTLLSCSAAIMVASQFWHGYGGGTYLAWFLPLAILTVFRPNLEDRVALSVLSETWLSRRRNHLRTVGTDAEQAA